MATDGESGEADIAVLEFDHIAARKRCNVPELAWSQTSLASLQAEIDPCEVRRCNCHRRKTAERRRRRVPPALGP